MFIGSFQHRVVYRGQRITFAELENVQRNVGRLISLNSFISTTPDREFAKVMSGMGVESVVASIVFEIHIDPVNAQSSLPFADITHLSKMQGECEVLLCMGTVLRVESVETNDSDRITWIRLSLHAYKSDRITQMKKCMTTKHLGSQSISESYLILSLARILSEIGEYDKTGRFMQIAWKQYEQESEKDIEFELTYYLLETSMAVNQCCLTDFTFSQLTSRFEQICQMSTLPEAARMVFQITHFNLSRLSSLLANGINDTDEFMIALENMYESIPSALCPEVIQLSDACNIIISESMAEWALAVKCSKQGDHEQALLIYERILKGQQDVSGSDHQNCATLLINLVAEARYIHDEEKMIRYNLELLNIRDLYASSMNSTHLCANINLAELYQERQEPEFALQFYENIINMNQLRPHDSFRLDAIYSSANIYSSFGDFDHALAYRQRAMDRERQSDPQFSTTLAYSDYANILVHDPFFETAGDARRMNKREAELSIYTQCLQSTDPIETYDRHRRILVSKAIEIHLEQQRGYVPILQYEQCGILTLAEKNPNHLNNTEKKPTSFPESINNLAQTVLREPRPFTLGKQNYFMRDANFQKWARKRMTKFFDEMLYGTSL